jgi:hypothetical protein
MPLLFKIAPGLLGQTSLSYSTMSSSIHPSFLVTFKYNSRRKFFFWNILSLQNKKKRCMLPSARTECLTFILSFSCPLVLTSTDFEPFISTAVLAGI